MSSAHEKQITALKEEISRLENLLAERPGDQQKSLAAAIGPESDSNSVVAQALLESEETLIGILNNVEDAVMTIDGTGTLYSFNATAEKMFGYPADVIIGQNIKLIMPEPHRGQHDIYVKAYQTNGESQILGKGPRELVGLRKDGGLFPIDLSISEMQISGQRRFIGTIRDISERKYAERAFRENAEELDAIYQTAGVGIGIADCNGRFLRCNKRLEEMLGYSEAEFVSTDITNLSHPEIRVRGCAGRFLKVNGKISNSIAASFAKTAQ